MLGLAKSSERCNCLGSSSTTTGFKPRWALPTAEVSQRFLDLFDALAAVRFFDVFEVTILYCCFHTNETEVTIVRPMSFSDWSFGFVANPSPNFVSDFVVAGVFAIAGMVMACNSLELTVSDVADKHLHISPFRYPRLFGKWSYHNTLC